MPTPNSGIPYVPENTIDPAAGLNESLRVIDALIQAAVIGFEEVTPPSTPDDGDRYIVGDSATGSWAGQDQNMAQYVSEGNFWQFYEAGQQVHLVLYAGSLYAYDGAWAAVAGGGGGGTGDVTGPASAVADQIAAFNGTTGKLIKDGGKTIAQVEADAAATARTPNVQSVTSAGTVTPTFSNDLIKITAQAAALTLANPSGTAIDGLGIVIRIKDNGTARAISYGSQYRAIGVTLPTTTVVGKTLYLAGIWNSEDTTLDIVAVGQQA